MAQCTPIFINGSSKCNVFKKAIYRMNTFFSGKYTKDYVSDALKKNAYIIIL